MARDLVLDVIAKKNSRDLVTLADEFDRLAKQTDDAGQSMHKTTTFSKFLEEQIAKTKVQVKELGDEFNRTGDKDVFGKLRGAESNLKSLEKIKDQLVKTLGDAGTDGGKEMTKNLSASLQGAESTPVLGPAIGGAIGAAVVAGGPLIAASLAGVIGAAIGAGGLALGIAGQIHDPEVQRAVHELGADLKSRLEVDTAGFKGPLISGIQEVDSAVRKLLDRFGSSRLAGALEPLARGVGAMIDKMGPGLSKLLDAAGPELEAVAAELPRFGAAIGDLFASLSKGEGGAQALRTIIQLTGGLLQMLGRFIAVGSEMYSVTVQIADGLTGWANALTRGIPLIGPFFDRLHQAWEDIDGKGIPTMGGLGRSLVDVSGKMGGVTRAADDQKRAVDDLVKSWDDMFNKAMSVDQAELRLHESMTGLTQSIRENGRHWDLNTEAGQRNRAALLGAIEAAERKRQADIAAGKDASAAATEFNKEVEQLLGIAAKAGLAKSQLDKLRGTYEVRVLTIYEQMYINKGKQLDREERLRSGKAHGGFASGGFWAGEQGKEWVDMNPGAGPAYVTPNSAINGAANSGAPQEQVHRIIIQYPNGQVLVDTVVGYGRATNRRTFDTLFPVGSAR